jgi:hypothetical protein
MDTGALRRKILKTKTSASFNETALEIFSLQYSHNEVYRAFCKGIGRDPKAVKAVEDIPFLPIELYKSQRVATAQEPEKMVFHSSGTDESGVSSHLIFDLELYEQSSLSGFRHFYGDPSEYCFALVIPSPDERPDSSLAHMGKVLKNASGNERSEFCMDDAYDRLVQLGKVSDQRLFVLGLSFALLDLAERGLTLPEGSIVAETGGMKGRRREMLREDLHAALRKGLDVQTIHSEYSMCELFSQAWSQHDGIFSCPPWMRVVVRDLYAPLDHLPPGRFGGLNIIDLANIDTCSFIATGDYGKVQANGCFEVAGRIRAGDVKGCSLMYEE